MERNVNVAVVGATGLVGREILAVLAERHFPVGKLSLLASKRSVGEVISFGEDQLTVQEATPEAFDGVDVALFSAGGEVSRALAPAAVARGAYVVDNSSAFRMQADVPLVVPEINAHALDGLRGPSIVANPNCSTIQMVVALHPLHQAASLVRVVASTYQAVSGAGQEGMAELSRQVGDLLAGRPSENKAFAHRIAFNCLPHIDVFDEEGHSFEETKMVQETRKILETPNLGVVCTCVRVPVFNGHSVSVTASFGRSMDRARAQHLLRTAPGVLLMDDVQQAVYPTCVEAEGQDATLVGRVRTDPSQKNSVAFWCVADNLRKGAATNAVQIAELLARRGAFVDRASA